MANLIVGVLLIFIGFFVLFTGLIPISILFGVVGLILIIRGALSLTGTVVGGTFRLATTKKCPFCRTRVPASAVVCPQCRSDIPNTISIHPNQRANSNSASTSTETLKVSSSPMHCVQCGSPITDESIFCTHCGVRLAN